MEDTPYIGFTGGRVLKFCPRGSLIKMNVKTMLMKFTMLIHMNQALMTFNTEMCVLYTYEV